MSSPLSPFERRCILTTTTVVCGWCDEVLGETVIPAAKGKAEGICNKCLNVHFPHHADLIRGILEVEKVEEFYVQRR